MRCLRLTALALTTLLAGCAGLLPKESLTQGQGNPALWQQHRQQVAQIDGWQISGKVGIRAPQDSGSGTLFWLQRQDYFDIRLSGPLGRGAARLTGHPGDTVLEVANQGRYQSDSPEALLEAQLGWRLPVSHLLWWVRGLPAPDSKSQLSLNGNSQLGQLQQDGWTIDYTEYQPDPFAHRPRRLVAQNGVARVRLVLELQLGHGLRRRVASAVHLSGRQLA